MACGVQIRTLETQMARSLTEEDVRALEAKIQAPLADARVGSRNQI